MSGCGQDTCEILVVYANACGASAANEDLGIAAGGGGTARKAEKKAIELCEKTWKGPVKL